MNNGVHLSRRHNAPMLRAYHHRGLGLGSVAHKDALFGKCQMHPRTLNASNLGNASR